MEDTGAADWQCNPATAPLPAGAGEEAHAPCSLRLVNAPPSSATRGGTGIQPGQGIRQRFGGRNCVRNRRTKTAIRSSLGSGATSYYKHVDARRRYANPTDEGLIAQQRDRQIEEDSRRPCSAPKNPRRATRHVWRVHRHPAHTSRESAAGPLLATSGLYSEFPSQKPRRSRP